MNHTMRHEINHIAKSHLRIVLISAVIILLGILSSNPASAQKKESSSKEHYSKDRYRQMTAKKTCKIANKKWRKLAQPPVYATKHKGNRLLFLAKK